MSPKLAIVVSLNLQVRSEFGIQQTPKKRTVEELIVAVSIQKNEKKPLR